MPTLQSTTPGKERSLPASGRERPANHSASPLAFTDNRPSAAAQRALNEASRTSPTVVQQKSLQDAADNSPIVTRQRAFAERADGSPRVLQQKALNDAAASSSLANPGRGRYSLTPSPVALSPRFAGQVPLPTLLPAALPAQQPLQLVKKGAKLKNAKETPGASDEEQEESPTLSGSQDYIQPKMTAVCAFLAGQNAIAAGVQAWFQNVIGNGLCGGWAKVHELYGPKFATVWQALDDWDPSAGIPALDKSLAKSHIGLHDIASMLIAAWKTMSVLEPEAGYGEVPEEVAELASDVSQDPTTPLKAVISNQRITVGKSGGGKALLEDIFAKANTKIKGRATIFVHIETQKHHMSLRLYKARKDANLEILEIVETEKNGVVSHPANDEAARILDGGIYLSGMNDYQLEYTISTTVKD